MYGNNAYGTTTYGDSGKGILYVIATLALKRAIRAYISTTLILKRTILRLGMIKPISYIKKSNIHLGVSSLIVKSKVLKENIISKFK